MKKEFLIVLVVILCSSYISDTKEKPASPVTIKIHFDASREIPLKLQEVNKDLKKVNRSIK